MSVADRAVEFFYTNYKGETGKRWATPLGLRWGSTEWHPEPQWLMRAFDHDKGAEREFALTDCDFRNCPIIEPAPPCRTEAKR